MSEIQLSAALNDLEPNALIAHEAEIDTEAEVDLVVAGGDFDPSLTKAPIGFLFLDSTGLQIAINPPSYELNGSVYDVTVQTTGAYSGAKLIALCKRV